MANIYVDTKILREKGTNVMKLALDLNEMLMSLYKRIGSMPLSTGEWVGETANEFVRILNVEKLQYFRLKDEIYKYGKILVASADVFESKVKLSQDRID